MADPKQARELIAEFPEDSLKALEEITFWFDSLSRTENFKLNYRYELYETLDNAARIHQRKLSQDYLSSDRKEKFRENKLWTTVYEFWKMLGDCYNQLLEQYQSGGRGAGAIKKELPVIAARAMRALTRQLKWGLLRYGPVDDRIWGELGRLYLFADAQRFASIPMQIYPGAQGQGTVRQEFLETLMLGVSSTDGLTPLRQEIAERTVAHFSAMYTMQEQPGLECNYYFDLSMRKAAGRVMHGFTANPMMRYFGAGEALPALRKLIDDIKAKDGVPAEINLGGTYENALVLSVMTHLATYWSAKPPARASERRQTATRLTVVHGLARLHSIVNPSAEDRSLDFQAKDGIESWVVENVSDGGFGVIIPRIKGDWVKVGGVLGVQSETAKFWSAGVVRRIACDEHQQRRVGIQLISKELIPVKVSPAASASAIDATREPEPAVLLSTTPDKNGDIALLLKAGSYSARQPLEMNVRGKSYYLLPRRLVEGGEDFDWAKFKVMKSE